MLQPSQVYKNSDGAYILRVTSKQVARVRDFSERSGKQIEIGGHLDGIEIVDEDDPNVDMITFNFLRMVVGVLPDGSAHS